MLVIAFLTLVAGMSLVLWWLLNRRRIVQASQTEANWDELLRNTGLDSEMEALQRRRQAAGATRRSGIIHTVADWLTRRDLTRTQEGRDVFHWLDEQLVQAGRPRGWSAPEALAFILLWWGLGLAGAVFAKIALGLPLLLVIAVLLVLVVYPPFKLRSLKRKRQEQAKLELATFINDLVMNLSSGMSTIDDALQRAVIDVDDAVVARRVLVREFAQAYGEYRNAGRDREEALQAVGQRLGVPSVSAFVDAIIQGLRTGAPLRETLMSQSQLAQEIFRQDMRAYIGKKETAFVFGLAMIVVGLIVIGATPLFMDMFDLFSKG